LNSIFFNLNCRQTARNPLAQRLMKHLELNCASIP
jgi:hypothetical protein